MIGTLAEATVASQIKRHMALPEGWSYLGSGAYRSAYLSPTGVVYKIEYPGGSSNTGEHRVYRDAKSKKAKGFRFAKCRLFKRFGILAMEYVQDDGSDAWQSWQEMRFFMSRHYHYSDCSEDKRGDNWHAVKGLAVITDYSYGWD